MIELPGAVTSVPTKGAHEMKDHWHSRTLLRVIWSAARSAAFLNDRDNFAVLRVHQDNLVVHLGGLILLQGGVFAGQLAR